MQVPFVDLKAQFATIRSDILAALLQPLDELDLPPGTNVRAFESEFAAYCQVAYALGVGSGTDALYLALRACGIRPGDEVVTVAHGFIATVEAIVQLGAVPVYVDIDPATYTLDPARLAAAVGPRTRAVVPVHLYGQPADMPPIMDIARRYGLVVVEDARQAHGATDRGHRAGGVGDAAAFSFSPAKNLGAYGDAGAVTTNSRAIAECVRALRDHGAAGEHEHQELGICSHLDELQAAVLRVKLRHLDDWNERRRGHARAYDELLAGATVERPAARPAGEHVFHRYVVQVPDRDRVRQALADRGVATGVHYPIPIHQQPAARGIGRVAGGLRVTEAVARRVLSLPIYAELQPEQRDYVAACLRGVSATKRLAIAR